ncbi:MAG: hypothetical protein AAFY11_04855 [Cyanobacteria bacterium J06641_5]
MWLFSGFAPGRKPFGLRQTAIATASGNSKGRSMAIALSLQLEEAIDLLR